MSFNNRQIKLVLTWYNLGLKNETKDYYMSFMSYWISFNSICYNLYHKDCVKERANIDTKKSKIRDLRNRLKRDEILYSENGTLSTKSNDKMTVDISFPSRLFLQIEKKFTEDLIYDKFVKDYTFWYDEEETDNLFDSLKSSLEKIDKETNESRYFIINMSRIDEYRRLILTEKLESLNGGIIFLCEKNSLYIIRKVLYQIRCNIFHGEKVPGNVIDDRITKNSIPMLKFLIDKLIEDYNIK